MCVFSLEADCLQFKILDKHGFGAPNFARRGQRLLHLSTSRVPLMLVPNSIQPMPTPNMPWEVSCSVPPANAMSNKVPETKRKEKKETI